MNKLLTIAACMSLTVALGAFDAQAKSGGGGSTGGAKPLEPCCGSPNQKATGSGTMTPVRKPPPPLDPCCGSPKRK